MDGTSTTGTIDGYTLNTSTDSRPLRLYGADRAQDDTGRGYGGSAKPISVRWLRVDDDLWLVDRFKRKSDGDSGSPFLAPVY